MPRLTASCALQQLLTPPPDQRLVYSDPTHAGEGGGEGWPRTPRQAAGEEEDDAGSDTPELQLSRCSSGRVVVIVLVVVVVVVVLVVAMRMPRRARQMPLRCHTRYRAARGAHRVYH